MPADRTAGRRSLPSPGSLAAIRCSTGSGSSSRQEKAKVSAKLVTERDGRRETINIRHNKPVMVGRNPEKCDYVIPEGLVSGQHCKFAVVQSPSDGVIVSCLILSRNGIQLNGDRINPSSVILMDGDSVTIGSRTFLCQHTEKEPKPRLTLFDLPESQEPADERALKVPRIRRMGRFVITDKCLGSGGFASVYLAMDVEGCRQIACKSLRLDKENSRRHDYREVVAKEVRMLKNLAHPNINRIFSHALDGEYIHIFLELCTGGDLFTYIVDRRRLNHAETQYITYQLLQATQYLHSLSISHRDIKPENILLHAPGPYPRVLLADFGLARPQSWQETKNVRGTVSYLPPEGIEAMCSRGQTYIGVPADCWSIGVVVYIMLTGSHPFDYDEPKTSQVETWIDHAKMSKDTTAVFSSAYERAEEKIKTRILQGQVNYEDEVWQQYPHAYEFVSQLMQYHLRNRWSVHGAVRSKWISGDLALLKTTYQARVKNKLSADDLATIERCKEENERRIRDSERMERDGRREAEQRRRQAIGLREARRAREGA